MRNAKKGEDFLEIGPGNLGLALDLLTKFTKGTLIDFNTTDVKQIYDGLKPTEKQRLNLIIADFLQYEFNQKFACVVACEVLEHIEDDRSFLRKMNQLNTNGGQLILSVPARQKYWSRDDEIVGHYRRYEKQDLHDKLVEAGYSDIQIVSYGFPFQNFVRWARISLAKLQYREKAQWDQKMQSQQSAFMIKRKSFNPMGLIVNKYSFYPLNVFASFFNGMDWAEGYIAFATKAAH
jgi:ubiquinone/menaquinone biosynthesis C-methylase UbiE